MKRSVPRNPRPVVQTASALARIARAAALFAPALAACRALPRAEPPPLLRVETEHHAGSLLTGPRPGPDEALADPWSLELAVLYVDELPDPPGEPLSAAAREVVAEGSDPLLRTRGELALDVRCTQASLGPAAGVRWRATRLEALWPGTTTVVRATRDASAPDAPRARWERFALEVSRRADAPDDAEVALALEGWVIPRPAREHAQGAAPVVEEPVLRREHVVLDRGPRPGGAPLTLLLPAPLEREPRGGFLVTLALREAPADDPAFARALEQGGRALEESRRSTHDRASLLTASESFRFESESALHALERPATQRSALLFLAEATDADLAGELALCATPETLAAALDYVRERMHGALEPQDDPAAFGWALERSTFQWIAERAGDEAQVLEPELESLLLRRAGELGRYPDLVLEALAEARGLAELEALILRENRIFLEDGHPAARVRAHDWLASRGGALEGYDPLGARDERRAALARADEAQPAAEPAAAVPAPVADDPARPGDGR